MKNCRSLRFIALFLSLLVFGCKSTQFNGSTSVDPLDLMDNDSSFYLRIPQETEPTVIEHMLKNFAKNLSDSDVKKISERVDTVYLGLNKSRRGVDFQLSSSCSFPQIAVKSAFSKKNGWNCEKVLFSDSLRNDVPYNVYNNSHFFVSFPESDIVCAGRSVLSMVEKYHYLSNNLEDESIVPLNNEVKTWLMYEDGIKDGQIRFFASKPQSFLTILTGANLNFKLDYVRGFLNNDPKNENQFLMQLEFEFRDSKLVQAGKAVLSVAFGLTDSNVFMTSPTHLVISGIKINKNQLYKILSI